MKNSFKPLLVIFIVAVALSVLIEPRSSGKGIIPWKHDLVAALAEANVSHRPILVEFSASWCGPCQEMARNTWADKAVAAELAKMIPVQIDVDSHADIAREYGVNPIPAYLLLDSSGRTLKSGEGYRNADEFLAWLRAKPSEP